MRLSFDRVARILQRDNDGAEDRRFFGLRAFLRRGFGRRLDRSSRHLDKIDIECFLLALAIDLETDEIPRFDPDMMIPDPQDVFTICSSLIYMEDCLTDESQRSAFKVPSPP